MTSKNEIMEKAADSRCPICKEKHLEFLKLESSKPIVLDVS